MQTMEL